MLIALQLPFVPGDSMQAEMFQTEDCKWYELNESSNTIVILTDKGKSLTPQSRAFASSLATTTAEYESLHCPMSRILGIPFESVAPISFSLRMKRFLAQPNVKISVSSGSSSARSVK